MTDGMSVRRLSRWAERSAATCASAALAVITLFLSTLAAADPFPGTPLEGIAHFGPPPADANGAVSSLDSRISSIVKAEACGNDMIFFLNARSGTTNENQLSQVIAKLAYLKTQLTGGGQPAPCQADGPFTKVDMTNIYKATDDNNQYYFQHAPYTWQDLVKFDWERTRALQVADWNAQMQNFFGPECGNSIATIDTAGSDAVRIAYNVSVDCMKRQVNVAVAGMSKYGQVGSSDLPCHLAIDASTKGEWDVKVRDLVRVYYLNPTDDAVSLVLDDKVQQHLFNDLLSISGPLGDASYSLFQCGDQEDSTGSPDDRADNTSDGGSFIGSVGDAGSWLLRRLALLLLFAAALLTLGALAGAIPVAGPIIVGVSTAGVAVIAYVLTFGRIPETENHRMMIETSRYLTNQIIIDHLSADDGEEFAENQKAIKTWLLNDFKTFLTSDFREYNARPYQRYSVIALLNIIDFAEDADLQRAATMVLDYDTAKFAVGSFQGRRLVPYRRHMEAVAWVAGLDTPPRDIFDFGTDADYMLELMLLATGDTAQLKNTAYWIDGSGAVDMVYPATSSFRPDPLVLDLALDKSPPSGQHSSYQAIHHAGFEIYSAGRGYLLTAGGVVAAAVNQLSLPIAPPGVDLWKSDDRGGALPTTLMLPVVRATTIDQFFRIEGELKSEKTVFDKDALKTYDYNVCMWRGFACGLNVRIPVYLNETAPGCIQGDPTGSNTGWMFLDTSDAHCPAEYQSGSRVFVVAFLDCLTPGNCGENRGFIEAAAASPGDDFEAFKLAVVSANPKINGTFAIYHARGGDSIQFNTRGDLSGDKRSRIVSINGKAPPGFDDWSFAAGDFITADGAGLVKIVNPRLGKSLNLDITDISQPKREVH
jgi:hypothetical protein